MKSYSSHKNQPIISVVLATRNEEKNIDRFFQSIKKQTYPKIEFIVIDNSTDKTAGLARKYTDQVFNLRDVTDLKDVKNFRGAQLNSGVEKSRGTIVFFPDADMTFDPGLLEEACELLEKKGIDALYIPEIVLGKHFFGKIRNFERSFYNTTAIDAVRVIKKSLFSKSGGFDEKTIAFGADDWDFTKKIKQQGIKTAITSNQIHHHEYDLDLTTYLNKKLHYSAAFPDYVKKWGKDDEDVKKQFGFYYRFFGVFTEQGKWKKLIGHPMLTIGMYLLRLAVGSIHLYQKLFNTPAKS